MITRWMQIALALLLMVALSACGAGKTTPASEQFAPAEEPAAEMDRTDEKPADEQLTTDDTVEQNTVPDTTMDGAGAVAEEEAADEEMAEVEEMAEMEAMPALEQPVPESVPVTRSESDAVVSQTAAPPSPPASSLTDDADQDAAESVPGNEGTAPEVDTLPEPVPTATVVPETLEVNPFVRTVDDNFSTFALDVDTASYTAARNHITNGQLPPPHTVRIEEFVNYFNYDYPLPQDSTFGIAVDAAPSPFAGEVNTQIVRVGLQGKAIEASERDNALLTFVIDISGSMSDPRRLPLVKASLQLLVNELREGDEIAIVVYSDNTRIVLDHTPATERDTILQAINSLEIEGATNVEEGLRLGYEVAARNFQNGAINRVILCSDGVANVGATSPEAIRETVRGYTEDGVYLTTVGFGMGDFNDYLMEQLANDGNGNYAYVDTIDAAERFFVEDLTGTLQVIAKDAKIQVEFNPSVVDRYRLLGYENRAIADEDFRDDSVDAGEVGASHNVTALYEVVLTEQGSGTALTVHLRYVDMETNEVYEVQQPFETTEIGSSFEEASPQLQLAVAVAGFAEQLRNSGYAQDRSLADVLTIVERIAPQLSNDQDVQELLQLVEQANNI